MNIKNMYENLIGKTVIAKSLGGIKVIGSLASIIEDNCILEGKILFPKGELNRDLIQLAQEKDIVDFNNPVIRTRATFRR